MLNSNTAPASYTTTTTATPTSPPSRPSRLRGLSYLRNYTHNHLHSLAPSSSRTNERPPLTRSASSPGSPSSPSATAPTPTQTTDSPSTERGSPVQLQSGENGGWIPTIQGRSGLSRDSLHPTSTSTESVSPEPTSTVGMTRSRAASTLGPTPTSNTAVRRASATDVLPANHASNNMPETTATPSGPSVGQPPTIRFIPHQEARSNRPSLQFPATSRSLHAATSIVRVGRFSEKDHASGDVVGFKSKVVSRRHCEFWCTDGQWYIKDVKSSSGTFLNHVRLSSPGVESRPYPVNDGDVVQLGIDFKGGEEVIFRCVKIRVECNRGWQKGLNNFNTSAHKRLFNHALKGKTRDSDAASVSSSECSICLNPVAPCQALFVAPCSHVWHFKCVRGYIHGPNYPHFNCPNCRLVSDLEADVEPPEADDDDDFDQALEEAIPHNGANGRGNEASEDTTGQSQSDGDERLRTPSNADSSLRGDDMEDDLAELLQQTSLNPPSLTAAGGSASVTRVDRSSSGALGATRPIDIAQRTSSRVQSSDTHSPRSTTPTTHTQFALAPGPVVEGPMTPRNDAGPFVLDGSAGRDRINHDLMSQAVAEVSEPASPAEQPVNSSGQ